MRTPPEDLGDSDVIASLGEGWGLDVAAAEYVAAGGGSHHWLVTGATGRRHFVTVDDLDRKGWLGDARDSAFAGLRRAFDTALALRRRCGLEFVVAPAPTPAGETVRRLGAHHSVAVFPFVDGSPGRFGEALVGAERAELVRMLARLHRTARSAAPAARPARLQPPGRGDLESALRDLDRRWAAGPFSEPARALLARHAGRVRRLLETFDRLSERVAAAGAGLVVTHGEPHPANVLRTGGRLLLIDWDTVGLAPPERDLWLVDAGAGDDLALYAETAGRPVDEAALRLYRLRWRLDDAATYLGWLRSPHGRTADTEHGWRSLAMVLESDEDP